MSCLDSTGEEDNHMSCSARANLQSTAEHPTSRLPVSSLGQHLPLVPCHKPSCNTQDDKEGLRKTGVSSANSTSCAHEASSLNCNHSHGNACSETVAHEGRQQTPLKFRDCYRYSPLAALSHLNMTASAEQRSIYSRTNSL